MSEIAKTIGQRTARKQTGHPFNQVLCLFHATGAVLRSGVLPLTLEEVTETMERTVKPQFRELNRKALHIEE